MAAVERFRHFRIVLIIGRARIGVLRLYGMSFVMHPRSISHRKSRSAMGLDSVLQLDIIPSNPWVFESSLVDIRIEYDFLCCGGGYLTTSADCASSAFFFVDVKNCFEVIA